LTFRLSLEIKDVVVVVVVVVKARTMLSLTWLNLVMVDRFQALANFLIHHQLLQKVIITSKNGQKLLENNHLAL